MSKPEGREYIEEVTVTDRRKKSGRRGKAAFTMTAAAAVVAAVLLLSGCTLKDVIKPVNEYFGREASLQEETAPVSVLDTLATAQVNDSQGRALVKPNGEPLTVLAAYETATGGEPRINDKGELETYPLGEIVTHVAGSPVLDAEGNPETYAGGEVIYDVMGLSVTDDNGNLATRAAGERVTHGADDIVYDAAGNRVTYQGEYMTYAAGEEMYDESGEKVTYPVAIQKDQYGEVITMPDGDTAIGKIEVVTDAAGDPFIDDNGEIATKQLEPAEPTKVVEPPFESGQYYIGYPDSVYYFFSTPEVDAFDINLAADDDVNPYDYADENGTGTVENLQLELLGDSIPYFDVVFDLEGYAYFIRQDTNEALTVIAGLRNGVNIMPREVVRTEYPQYKYWDDPLYTVADNQKWIVEAESDGTYTIHSYMDPTYVITVDDQYGVNHANLMLWKADGRTQQKFSFQTGAPSIPKYIDEGTYYISSGLSDWMMLTFGDEVFYDGADLYLDSSNQGNGQMFTVKYDKYGFATIIHGDKKSKAALSVSAGQAYEGQSVIQYEEDGDNWQKWIIAPHKHGGYVITSALDYNLVLDLAGGYAKVGNGIYLYSMNDTFAQSWNFHKKGIPDGHSYESMDDYAQNFSSETEYLILINNWMNVVGVYQGEKGKWKNIYFVSCVTGKESTPTVRGEYSIYAKSPSFDGNMDTPVWYTCYYASMFYPEYFFHSIIYYQGTWDVMDSTMGWSASHGCVRLDTDIAEWIYDNVPLGTKVVSY